MDLGWAIVGMRLCVEGRECVGESVIEPTTPLQTKTNSLIVWKYCHMTLRVKGSDTRMALSESAYSKKNNLRDARKRAGLAFSFFRHGVDSKYPTTVLTCHGTDIVPAFQLHLLGSYRQPKRRQWPSLWNSSSAH